MTWWHRGWTCHGLRASNGVWASWPILTPLCWKTSTKNIILRKDKKERQHHGQKQWKQQKHPGLHKGREETAMVVVGWSMSGELGSEQETVEEGGPDGTNASESVGWIVGQVVLERFCLTPFAVIWNSHCFQHRKNRQSNFRKSKEPAKQQV